MESKQTILTTQAFSKIFFDFFYFFGVLSPPTWNKWQGNKMDKVESQTLSLWMSNASAFCKINDELCIFKSVFYVI